MAHIDIIKPSYAVIYKISDQSRIIDHFKKICLILMYLGDRTSQLICNFGGKCDIKKYNCNPVVKTILLSKFKIIKCQRSMTDIDQKIHELK